MLDKTTNKPRRTLSRSSAKPSGNKPRKLDAHEQVLVGMMRDQRDVTVHLASGGKHIGKIAEFDKYCIVLKPTADSRVVLFKHAIESFM